MKGESDVKTILSCECGPRDSLRLLKIVEFVFVMCDGVGSWELLNRARSRTTHTTYKKKKPRIRKGNKRGVDELHKEGGLS
jgi:hypothetical protein